MAWFREAVDELPVAYKLVSAAEIAGSSLRMQAGYWPSPGWSHSPAGIPILVFGAALGVGGGITGVGATIGDVVNNRRALK